MQEKIEEKLNEIEERIKLSKENGCKLLECKTIDRNIALQLENIKLKKMCNKLAEVVDLGCIDITCSPMCVHDNCIKECALDWAKREVEK